MQRRGPSPPARSPGLPAVWLLPGTTDPSADAGTPLAQHGVPQTVSEEEPVGVNGPSGVADPVTPADWSGIDVSPPYHGMDRDGLTPDSTVIGVTIGDSGRAYALRVLARVDVVNDDVGGPFPVTYCLLGNSGMVARGELAGGVSQLRMSGLLWLPPGIPAAKSEAEDRVFGASAGDPDAALRRAGNLVMADGRTSSYWSQLLAQPICGPERVTTPVARPSTTATWAAWQQEYPKTGVVLSPPYSTSV